MSQSYGFSRSRVWMWELDHKESWASKNWCFWTVVLEKMLESRLDCREIKPVNPEGNQPLTVIGKTDAEAEVPIFWPPDVKSGLIGKDTDAGKDWRQKRRAWQRMRWLDSITNWLNGLEFEQTLGDSEGQGSLVCCSSRGCKGSDTDLRDWTATNSQWGWITS